MKKEGFRRLSEGGEWRSCYYHDELKVLLAIYVDDFKMAGTEEACAAAWKMLREGEGGILMDEPTPISSYLGCTHKIHEITKDGVTITAIEYDMQGQLEQAIQVYKDLAKVTSLPEAMTPFLPEDETPNPSKEPTHIGEGLQCPWCRSIYPEDAFEKVNNNENKGRKREQESVLKPGGSWPQEGAGGTLGSAGADGTGGALGAAGTRRNVQQGGAVPNCAAQVDYGRTLRDDAAKFVMKVLYTARLARPDLLRAIGFLACHLTKWNDECDKRLYRLMQYIQSTLEYRQYGWTDGDVSNMTLHVYSDADFAGCSISNRSTTGAHVSIEGRRTKFPIANTSKNKDAYR